MSQQCDLNVIMHSKRANIFYLEHCRVMQKDGVVVFLTELKNSNAYYNIPIANTTFLLLGTGTSISQAAIKLLSKAGVSVGFCGGEGTPLYTGTEIQWITAQNNYRNPQYAQQWFAMWCDKTKQLKTAKLFQQTRIDYVRQIWHKAKICNEYIEPSLLETVIEGFMTGINKSTSINELLGYEGNFTKSLYALMAQSCKIDFTRDYQSDDTINKFLNIGHHLTYGLATTVLWVLGIPQGFGVMHGKTTNGALVFDVADIVKNGIILPFAFTCAKQKYDTKDFRRLCIENFLKYKTLDYMFHSMEGMIDSECDVCEP